MSYMINSNTQSFSSRVQECADGLRAIYSSVLDSFNSFPMYSAGGQGKGGDMLLLAPLVSMSFLLLPP